MSTLNKISVTIVAKDAARTIGQCLEALTEFDEVVVVLDRSSTDLTAEIVKGYTNVALFHSDFEGFGKIKQYAVSCAGNDWILSIDADEVVSHSLLNRLRALVLDPTHVYAPLRHNHYKGRHIDACGWNHDYPVRLFNRTATSFTNARIHEAVITTGMPVIKLKEAILHYAYTSESELQQKAERYASLYAEENYRRKHTCFIKTALKTSFTFFKDFFLRKGLLYGWDGFTIAWYNALGVYLKYSKLDATNKDLQISLIISTYNRPDALRLVLESICRQHRLPDQVIIADDGSSGETQKVIETFATKLPDMAHVWHEDKGFRLADIRNKAIKAAKHPFISMVDGDMVLHPDFMLTIYRLAIKNTMLQGKRVLLGQKITGQLLQGARSSVGFFSPDILNRWNTISLPSLSSLISRKYNKIKGVKGCSMHFWKEDAERINGFNEAFVGWGREDSEFVCRLLNAGVTRKNIIVGAVAYHLYHNEASREMLLENDRILEQCISNETRWCDFGLQQPI
ncbi:MAG: glycosyltransferase [Saprospiraceae bacterium]|nr:glycosyltransferase [Saprospiraceae bacterium]